LDDSVEPNGILFSPDEKRLYVIDSGKGQWAQILTPGVGGQNVRFDHQPSIVTV
jgi:sugar lactone lactonase YvrE